MDHISKVVDTRSQTSFRPNGFSHSESFIGFPSEFTWMMFEMVDHTLIHFEIPADNVEKLRSFYAELFGWKIEKTPGPMDYWIIQTVPVDEKGMTVRPGVNGGMMKKQHPEHKPTNYIAVESVDDYVKKIESLGGKITVPKMEVPGVGWWAMAIDPEGNQFAILETVEH